MLAASASLLIIALYLIAQMVGAGKLIVLLFGLDYNVAVVIVGSLMMIYVTFGGMTATTWVQIIKAVLMLFGATLMTILVMAAFNFNPDSLLAEATRVHPAGRELLAPGAQVSSNPLNVLSLGIALAFGTAGLPHILMRFFTVADAKEARKSVIYASSFIGYFYLLTFIIGFGAVALLVRHPEYYTTGPQGGFDMLKNLIGGTNMVAVHLANAVGGNLLLGFLAAVTFATIVAVVAGLALAGAAAISHDLYANVIARGRATEHQQMRISRLSTIALGVMAILLGTCSRTRTLPSWWAWPLPLPPVPTSRFWCCRLPGVVAPHGAPPLAASWAWPGHDMGRAEPHRLVDVFGFAAPVVPFPNPPASCPSRWLSSRSGCSQAGPQPAQAPEARHVRRADRPQPDGHRRHERHRSLTVQRSHHEPHPRSLSRARGLRRPAYGDAGTVRGAVRRLAERSDAFWAKAARRLHWYREPRQVRDVSFAADDFHIRWYADGELNVSVNCLDRQLETRGDKPAR